MKYVHLLHLHVMVQGTCMCIWAVLVSQGQSLKSSQCCIFISAVCKQAGWLPQLPRHEALSSYVTVPA